MKLLAPYVDFSDSSQAGPPEPTQHDQPAVSSVNSNADAGSPTGQLKRGMQINDVTNLLGQGRQLSESVSPEGLKTQVFEYLTGDRRVEVTYVEGLVVRFSISSR
jgi:hypothetical protein